MRPILLASLSLSLAAAELTGRIQDTSGRPLPGALVELMGPGTTARAVTGPEGTYRLPVMVAARLRVRVSHPGYLTLHRAVTVPETGSASLSAALQPYGATVDVQARAGVANRSRLDAPLNALVGIADLASEGLVTPGQLASRPYQRPADVLETVPGLLISQHSGEGKANQYYLRGFNLDHGTDLAIRLAGVPMNLPTNAHGQGYLDLNGLIPELVSRVQYRKGTAFADEGDFSAAGAVDIGYVHALERPLATLELGGGGFQRGLFAGSWNVAGGDLLLAQEAMATDGPWEVPEGLRRSNTVLRYSRGTESRRWSLTALAYDARWTATDQIPRRAFETGTLGWFGSLDPTNGGDTRRLSLAFAFHQEREGVRDRVEAHWSAYRLSLTSNFTGWLDHPEEGDQFQQAERRTYGGFHATRTWEAAVLGRPAEATAGLQVRWDLIPSVGLWHTQERRRLHTVREDAVSQHSLSGYAQLKVQWAEELRSTLGLRHDRHRFAVRAGLPENGGAASEALTSPKLAVVLGPWRDTELYLSAARGFHSNDARGTTLRVDPGTGEAAERVTPLVKATGYEVGVRSAASPRWRWSVALWRLDLASELVFLGDAGITEPSRPSRRTGFEATQTLTLASWASLDLDLAYSRARFTAFDPAGDRIPGAVEGVGSLSLNLRPAQAWQVTLGLRHFGGRPLVEDASVRSTGSTLASMKATFEPMPRLRLTAEVFNLGSSQASDIDYFYRSRLPGEPEEGVDDIHFHPVEPRTVRLGVGWRF